MPKTSFADLVTQWERLLTNVEAHAAELPHLETWRAELQAIIPQAKALFARNSIQRAESQQSTRDLEVLMTRGKDLATRLRAGVKSQYGFKGEKLTAFGLQPFRRRPRKSDPEQPAPPPAPVPAPDPAPAPEPPSVSGGAVDRRS